MVASASLVAGTSLAGCVGTDGEPETETDEETEDGSAADGDGDDANGSEPAPLEINTLQPIAEEPTGYREFEPLDDRAFSGTDPVWFYFEPVGVRTTTKDDGVQVALSSELTISIEDTTVFDDTVSFEDVLAPDQVDELYLTLTFTPTSDVQPGRYTAEIALTDDQHENGHEATAKTEFRIEDSGPRRPDTELAVDTFEFVHDRPTGYGEYTPVDDPVFGPDETIWLYIEPEGVALERREDEDWFELDVMITLRSPDGEEHRPIRERETSSVSGSEALDELYFAIDLSPRDPTLGEYTVELEVADRVARQETTTTRTFEIYDRDHELLEIYREILEAEGLEIERLRLRDGTLALKYHSAYEYGTEGFLEEVGTAAGGYAGVVEGWESATQLRASGTDTADQEFVFRVERDVAQAWNDEEITRREYVDRVLESLRERD